MTGARPESRLQGRACDRTRCATSIDIDGNFRKAALVHTHTHSMGTMYGIATRACTSVLAQTSHA